MQYLQLRTIPFKEFLSERLVIICEPQPRRYRPIPGKPLETAGREKATTINVRE